MSERNKRKQQICFWLILLLWAGLSAAGYYYSGRRDPTIDFPTGWKLQLILCGRYLLGFLLGAAISGRIDRIRLKNLSHSWKIWLAFALWLAFVWKVYFPFLYRYDVSPIGYFISRGFALGIPVPFLFSNGDAEHHS